MSGTDNWLLHHRATVTATPGLVPAGRAGLVIWAINIDCITDAAHSITVDGTVLWSTTTFASANANRVHFWPFPAGIYGGPGDPTFTMGGVANLDIYYVVV